jgi:hypothetical protein
LFINICKCSRYDGNFDDFGRRIVKSNIELLLEKYPDIEIKDTKFGPEFIYYIPSVLAGEIKICKDSRHIYKNADLIKFMASGKYSSKDSAVSAISAVMPEALLKFKKCSNALNLLTSEMGFAFGDTYDGDTYGIFNEYTYIRFNIGGFEFDFKYREQ